MRERHGAMLWRQTTKENMVNLQVLRDEGIIIVEPSGHLEEADLLEIEKEIKTIIEEKTFLAGLIIHTKSFPGWDDLNAFKHHLQFVKDFHKQIKRVAIVTDYALARLAPGIASKFVDAELKHFPFNNYDQARQWIKKAV